MKLYLRVTITDLKLVPWSATEVVAGRNRKTGGRYFGKKKEPRLIAFQEQIQYTARAIVGGSKPALKSPCLLNLVMVKRTEDESKWGTICYAPLGTATNTRGDVTNLFKAIEDGLQGVFYVSDQLVCATSAVIFWGSKDMVVAKVYTLDEPIDIKLPDCPALAMS